MGDEKPGRGDRRFITFAFSHSAAGNCFNPAPSILLSFANPNTAPSASQRRNGVLPCAGEDGLDNSEREARRRYYVLFKKNGLRGTSYGLARVNYTRARAAEIVGGGSARAKRANGRNGSRMRVIMVENSWTRARETGGREKNNALSSDFAGALRRSPRRVRDEISRTTDCLTL